MTTEPELITADEHEVFLTLAQRLTRHNIGVLVVLDLAGGLPVKRAPALVLCLAGCLPIEIPDNPPKTPLTLPLADGRGVVVHRAPLVLLLWRSRLLMATRLLWCLTRMA